MRNHTGRLRVMVVLLFAVIVTGCKRSQNLGAPAADLTADEYTTFSAYIAGRFGDRDRHLGSNEVSTLVFFNQTRCDDRHSLRDYNNGQPLPWEKTAAFLRSKAPVLQPTTLESFLKANSQQAFVHPSFHVPIKYELVDLAKETSIFRKDGGDWLDFYKQYPGSSGIVTWSRVGFNADGTQAIFYYEKACGGLCGGGNYVVMEKRDGGWIIGIESSMWVS